MKKVRTAVAAVLVTVGLLLVIGAVGNGDFYGYLTAADFVHIAVGLAMAGAGMIAEVIAERKNE